MRDLNSASQTLQDTNQYPEFAQDIPNSWQTSAMDTGRDTPYSGNDLSPAMLLLAAEPGLGNVLVLTDTQIGYPPLAKIPYNVCWAVLDAESSFRPDYGRTIFVKMGR